MELASRVGGVELAAQVRQLRLELLQLRIRAQSLHAHQIANGRNCVQGSIDIIHVLEHTGSVLEGHLADHLATGADVVLVEGEAVVEEALGSGLDGAVEVAEVILEGLELASRDIVGLMQHDGGVAAGHFLEDHGDGAADRGDAHQNAAADDDPHGVVCTARSPHGPLSGRLALLHKRLRGAPRSAEQREGVRGLNREHIPTARWLDNGSDGSNRQAAEDEGNESAAELH
mmetsp:Transcript_48904/g.127637  ORF Transcript_48904/g.127637 Transcript_48904/m.127637 type:complete len:230 (+) Transcript_48904:2253-2942(+)